ncbi:MAG: hypothetical protein IIC51_08030 [Planctomycetes bacterium]|nr:hypothetical protein [Planctomycetota bacterium]
MKPVFKMVAMVVAVSAVLCISAGVALADSGADHKIRRTRPIDLGVSGVNREDFCFVRGGNFVVCSTGTLGSLVEDGGGTLYILSNNHVLAELNQSSIGDDVIQPGYLDDCFNQDPSANVVADLSEFVTLDFSGADNLVDSAIAEIRAGEVDTSGTILDIGTVGTTTATVTVGQAVKKSGRTSGLTNGTVDTVSVTVNVGYDPCGSGGQPDFIGHFVDQIAITPGSFIAGGDSGSLVLNSSNQAVGLVFAGSSAIAIANKIDNVLCAFSTPLAMAGGTPNCGGGCTSDPECDDGDPCNGSETCDLGSGTCQPGTPINCDDSDACTDDGCDSGTGNCTHTPTNCDDGDACTVDTCDSVTGCANTFPACGAADGCCGPACTPANDPDCDACGDGVCEGNGEDCFSCPADCRCAGGPNCNACCGDGVCGGPGESASNCPVDCGGGASGGEIHRIVGFEKAAEIKRRHSDALFAASPLVVGHGIGADAQGNPVIVVYFSKENAQDRAKIPAAIEGLPTRIKVTGPFRALTCH